MCFGRLSLVSDGPMLQRLCNRAKQKVSYASYARPNAGKCMMALSGVMRVAACRKSFLQDMVTIVIASMAACMLSEVVFEALGALDVER